MARLGLMALLGVLAFQDQQRPIAIVHVTVVPMDRERVVTDQTVIVQDGRIKAIGQAQSIQIPNGAVQIDGRGKYLMPGLADMHVHFVREALKQESPRSSSNNSVRQPGIPASASDDHERENRAYALMFVANGVTTVRNLWGSETIDAFADEIDSGAVIGPHVYSSGPITDGDPPIWQSSRIVETAAQAEDAVRSDKQKGYVAIKVYSALSNEAYHTIVGAAKRQGMPVVGHVPINVGLMGAVEARQDSIEHLDSFPAALQPDGAPGGPKPLGERIRDADPKKLPAVVRAIKEAGVWICPTVVVNDLPRTDSTWLEEASFVPPDVFERYQRMYPNRGIDPRATAQAHALNIAIVAALHSGGAHLLLGTDTVKLGTIPGFSLHDELDNFVKAGLTPYEAIRAGTADAAIFLREEKEFGTVSVGQRADLLLLNKNPLDDVRNTETPAGVMTGGRWHTAEDLKEQLRTLRATYKHPAVVAQSAAPASQTHVVIPFLADASKSTDIEFEGGECELDASRNGMACTFQQVFLTMSAVAPDTCLITTNRYDRVFRREAASRWTSTEGPDGLCGVLDVATLQDDGGVQWTMETHKVVTKRNASPTCEAFDTRSVTLGWQNIRRPLPCRFVQPGALSR